MLAMNTAPLASAQDRPRPTAKAPPRARRLVLVPAANGRDDELVRRYRLARLRLESREVRGAARFAHLKDFHD